MWHLANDKRHCAAKDQNTKHFHNQCLTINPVHFLLSYRLAVKLVIFSFVHFNNTLWTDIATGTQSHRTSELAFIHQWIFTSPYSHRYTYYSEPLINICKKDVAQVALTWHVTWHMTWMLVNREAEIHQQHQIVTTGWVIIHHTYMTINKCIWEKATGHGGEALLGHGQENTHNGDVIAWLTQPGVLTAAQNRHRARYVTHGHLVTLKNHNITNRYISKITNNQVSRNEYKRHVSVGAVLARHMYY